jgi:hypothetical protein
MKSRHLAFLVVAVVVLVLVGRSWRQIPAPDARSSANAVLSPASATVMPDDPAAATLQPPRASSVTPTKEEHVRAVLDAHNHKDIEFYGKVIDQYGNPLSDVHVTASVIYNSGEKAGVLEARTTTDPEGVFSFTGMKGRTFDCHLEKTGYQTMPERDAFDYTELVPAEQRHRPDPRNPVVLKMWKLQGAEPLVHFERKYFPLPTDGTPVQIDLSTGTQVATGGDFVLTLNHIVLARGALPEPQFDWRARAEVAGGGLIESNQRLMYHAPEAGYTAVLTIDMPAEKPDWANSINRSYYVRTRGNLFGRVEIYLNANQRGYDPSYVMLQWWLNPKPGSRTLEVAGQVVHALPENVRK